MDKYQLDFIGPWQEEDRLFILQKLQEAGRIDDASPLVMECYYRSVGVPYKARFYAVGEFQGPVAYGREALVENILNCFPIRRSV